MKKQTLGKVSNQLKALADDLAALTIGINSVELYTAANAREEKSKLFENFRKNKIYNPIFKYPTAVNSSTPKLKNKLTGLVRRIRKHTPKSTLDKVARGTILAKINDDLLTIDMVEGIKRGDDQLIKNALRRKHPPVDKALYNLAQKTYVLHCQKDRILKSFLSTAEKKWLENTYINSQELKAMFVWTLKKCGLLRTSKNKLGFKIVIDKTTTFIDMRDKEADGPTGFIPQDKKISLARALELNAHEIEGHARQSINGQMLLDIPFAAIKYDEALYEGLGMRYEEQIKLRFFGIDPKPPYRLFTQAVELAERGFTFYQIYTEIYKMITKIPAKTRDKALEDAWEVTYRIMRGHIDTTNKAKYAMRKDLAYLRGWQLDKNLQNEGWGFLNELATVPLETLPLLKETQISQKDLSFPFLDATTSYWLEVLKPQFEKAMKAQ